jgi:hypothetical protein
MTLTPELRRLCLAHSNAVLVPAEALTQAGMAPEFADLLVKERRLTIDQVRMLERGFALYWERCADLFKRAPGSWFPPRQTNLLIAAEPRGILLYLEPFKNASSLLYVDDLEGDAEYVAYLLIHMERLSLLRSAGAAVVHNLSYWFDRDDHARQAFAAAARRSRRPDALCFIAVAESLAWVDGLVHCATSRAANATDRTAWRDRRRGSLRAAATAAAGDRVGQCGRRGRPCSDAAGSGGILWRIGQRA